MKPARLDQLIDSTKQTGGKWVLTPDHEIRYQSRNRREEFVFKGSLVAAEPDFLVISVTETQEDQRVIGQIIRLSGKWKSSPKNQIQFEVERESGKSDVLTFKGLWKVNQANELIYIYGQRRLKSRKRVDQEISFQGFWDISGKNRLTYRLSESSDSVFHFRGAFQTNSILAKKNELRYQAGVEVNGKLKTREIILFGKWKFSHDLELSFEVEYEDGRRKAIVFGVEYALGHGSRIAVNLKNRDGEELGAELVLTKDLFGKDGQAFVRLVRSLEESKAEAGVGLRW